MPPRRPRPYVFMKLQLDTILGPNNVRVGGCLTEVHERDGVVRLTFAGGYRCFMDVDQASTIAFAAWGTGSFRATCLTMVFYCRGTTTDMALAVLPDPTCAIVIGGLCETTTVLDCTGDAFHFVTAREDTRPLFRPSAIHGNGMRCGPFTRVDGSVRPVVSVGGDDTWVWLPCLFRPGVAKVITVRKQGRVERVARVTLRMPGGLRRVVEGRSVERLRRKLGGLCECSREYVCAFFAVGL